MTDPSLVGSDPDVAIPFFESVLAGLTLKDDPEDWAACHDFLGLFYGNRPSGDRSANLEQAIEHYEAALRVQTREHAPQVWAGIQAGLGDVYKDRVLGDRAENWDRAEAYYLCALDGMNSDQNPAQWATVQMDLADLYRRDEFDTTGRALDQAIDCYESALSVTDREVDELRWARICHQLGDCFGERRRGEPAANEEASIAYYEQALEVFRRKDRPQNWAATTTNLGVTYLNRTTGSRPDNLHRAIHCLSSAGETYDRASPDWVLTQTNLANAYLQLSGLQKAANVERAIELYGSALDTVDPETAPDQWATIHFNLGNAYRERRWWDMTGYVSGEAGLETWVRERAGDIECAIDHYREALAVFTREERPRDWALATHGLGAAYLARILGKRADNVERAIRLLNEALELRDRETWPAGWAATHEVIGVAFEVMPVGDKAENIRNAVDHYRMALEVYDSGGYALRRRQTLGHLARLAFRRDAWREALELYEQVIETPPSDGSTSLGPGALEFEIESTADAYPNAAYCLLKLDRPAEAFTLVEESKARQLAEALRYRGETETDDALPPSVRQLIDWAHHRPSSSATSLVATVRPFHSAADLYSTFGDGSEIVDFVIEPASDDPPASSPQPEPAPSSTAVADGTLLIAPLVTSRGGAVMLLGGPPDELGMQDVVWLDELTTARLATILADWLKASSEHPARPEWKPVIERVTSRVWDLLFEPLVEHLERYDVNSLVLLPPGRLQLLPLHAAWRRVDGEPRYLLDDYAISYAPSAGIHALCRERLDHPLHNGALAVGINTYGPENSLVGAVPEAQMVAQLIGATPLLEEAATGQAVRDEMPGKRILHFACHARYGWTGRPLDSALYLTDDEPLTLQDLLSCPSLEGSRLVTLSACETGLANLTNSPDEFVGLPAGFLLLGAPGIVSSLLVVGDYSTALLMGRFYEAHIADGQPPAEALRAAQCWLRDATREQLRTHGRSLSRSGTSEVALACEKLGSAGDPDERPFAHPFFWAPFQLIGT